MPILNFCHRHQIVLIIALLTLAGTFVRLYGLGAWDYYYDEMWHVYVAKQPTLADVFHTNLIEDGHPPLLYFIWHYLLELWDNPWMARLPSLVCGILAILMGYLLGKELFGSKNGGLFAAFFMAFSNLLIEQSDVVRGYAMMMLFCMTAIWSVYRYRDTSRLIYVFAYAFSISVALLCEFPAIPIAVFTGLFVLCNIARQPKPSLRALCIVGVANIALIAYLLWFNHVLHSVGMLDFSQAKVYREKFMLSPLNYFILHYVSFFLDYINESGFLFQVSVGSDSQALYILGLFFFLFVFIAGFVWLVRERRWWLLALVLLPMVIGIGFDYLQIIPLENIYCRRQIAISFGMMILFYGGCRQMLRYFPKKNIITFSPTLFTIAMTGIICMGYAAYGTQWRVLRPTEFQQSLDDTKEVFSFLKKRVRKNDVIITDWVSYFHFWNTRSCPAVRISPMVMYYPCYDVPLFILHDDISHLEAYKMNTRALQQAMQELDRLHRFNNVGNIWMVGFQHGDTKPIALAMHFDILDKSFLERHKEYAPEAKILTDEQQSVARALYDAAGIKRIAYAYPCGIDDDSIVIGGDDRCVIKFMLIALPKEVIYERLINHPPYHDPKVFIGRVKKDMEK